MIKNQIIVENGQRWKIREAKSMAHALEAIAYASVSGSVGEQHVLDKSLCGGGIEVLADVVKVNSDDSERQPYQTPY